MKTRNYTIEEINERLDAIIYDFGTAKVLDEWIAQANIDEKISFYEHLCRMWDL